MSGVLLDGIIFSLQRYGGISVYFRELIRFLNESKISGKVIIEEPTMQSIDLAGGSLSLKVEHGRFLERIRSCRIDEKKGVFHSSYYRVPSNRFMPSVVTVFDFIAESSENKNELKTRQMGRWMHAIQKRRAIESAQAIICISQSTKMDLLNIIPKSINIPIHVIHMGASSSYRVMDSSEPKTRFILYVGTRRGYKNFSCASRAMEFLPNLELWCVGGEEPSRLDLDGLSVKVRKQIHFLGPLSEIALNHLYNSAYCLVYPSSYEGFGIPVAEAMRAGCPVVSIDCIAVKEIGGLALEVAEENHPVALAEAIKRLETEDYRKAKIKLGLDLSINYSWQRCHEKTFLVYKNILDLQ